MAPNVNFDKAPVKVLVGPDRAAFYIHSSILTSTSEFFIAALKQDLVEGHQREITIGWAQPTTFKIYLLWLYSGPTDLRRLSRTCSALRPRRESHRSHIPEPRREYLHHQSHADQDCNLACLHPGSQVIATIFSNTPCGSPARRSMINLYQMYEGDISDLEPGFETIHVEFLVDGYNESLKDERVGFTDQMHLIDKIRTACAYHKHADDKNCGPEVLAKVQEELN